MRRLEHAQVRGKTVLLRVDFNVPMQGGRVMDDTRIRRALPTIRWLSRSGAKVVIVSHLGRPNGIHNPAFSLAPAAKQLAKLLRQKVHFLTEHPGAIRDAISHLPRRAIILLENIRFYPEEEKNDPQFARLLAGLADCYVNDAFGAAHRNAASLVAITKFLPSYPGLLMREELSALDRVLAARQKPFALILGGAKLEDKLPLINRFLRRADYVLTGGGVANTLAKAKGVDVGQSLYEEALVGRVKRIAGVQSVGVPDDWKIAGGKILDIGPRTAARYAGAIKKAKMVLWNGPMGFVEDRRFRAGSVAVAAAIAQNRRAFSVAGGGDTAAFIRTLGLERKFSFISTGGGAMLEYLAGMKLPAIEALKATRHFRGH